MVTYPVDSAIQRLNHWGQFFAMNIQDDAEAYFPFGNQAFSQNECNIFPGLSYNKANNTFLNSIRKNKVEAQVKFTLKIMERARAPVIAVTVKKDSLLLYVLNFFGILAGRCGV